MDDASRFPTHDRPAHHGHGHGHNVTTTTANAFTVRPPTY